MSCNRRTVHCRVISSLRTVFHLRTASYHHSRPYRPVNVDNTMHNSRPAYDTFTKKPRHDGSFTYRQERCTRRDDLIHDYYDNDHNNYHRRDRYSLHHYRDRVYHRDYRDDSRDWRNPQDRRDDFFEDCRDNNRRQILKPSPKRREAMGSRGSKHKNRPNDDKRRNTHNGGKEQYTTKKGMSKETLYAPGPRPPRLLPLLKNTFDHSGPTPSLVSKASPERTSLDAHDQPPRRPEIVAPQKMQDTLYYDFVPLNMPCLFYQ